MLLSWLALFGGVASNVLALLTRNGLVGPGLAGCGTSGCRATAQSPWSTLPPGPPVLETGLPNIPVAALGLALFVALAVGFARGHGLSRGLAAIGALGAIAYTLIGLLVLPTPCALCLTSHASGLTLGIVAHYRGTRAELRSTAIAVISGTVAAVLVLVLTAPSTDRLLDDWRRSPEVQAGEARVVVFTDPTCPSCRVFHDFTRGPLEPLLEGVSIQWRLIPSGDGRAARALATADSLGHFDAALDAFMAAENTTLSTGATLAETLDVDIERWEAVSSAPAVESRLRVDTAASRALEISHLPSVYLDGRAVPARALQWLPFWRRAL